MSKKKKAPRSTPDRDSKYMGLAWIHAGFSKDPSTQVGAQLVTSCNEPLGSGYNGPPSCIEDDSFSWERPPKDDPEAFSKYDVVVHAEINAIKHSLNRGYDLTNSTLYVTAFPCKSCMLDIVDHQIGRVVYMDFRSGKGSLLQNTKGRESSLEIARLAGIHVESFKGNISWVADWTEKLRQMGVFQM